uniref:Uncharacterized protein n=1 Tax=Kalanchoe fedtschenkoi TaxID=63787 RepID=A0A7N0ZVY4_KALFE
MFLCPYVLKAFTLVPSPCKWTLLVATLLKRFFIGLMMELASSRKLLETSIHMISNSNMNLDAFDFLYSCFARKLKICLLCVPMKNRGAKFLDKIEM